MVLNITKSTYRKGNRVVSTPPEPFSSQNEPIEGPEQPVTPETPEQPSQKGEAYYPASTFPQVQVDETHGGPLGCCLGVVVGLLLTMLIMFSISLALSNGGFLGVATLPVSLIGGIIGGFLGWRIGHAIYRVYEAPVVRDKRPKKPQTKRKRA
jgi:hypothetical protein